MFWAENNTIKDEEIEMSMEREGQTMRLNLSIVHDILQVRSNWLCRKRLIELFWIVAIYMICSVYSGSSWLNALGGLHHLSS